MSCSIVPPGMKRLEKPTALPSSITTTVEWYDVWMCREAHADIKLGPESRHALILKVVLE
jgi:hypothetical protein